VVRRLILAAAVLAVAALVAGTLLLGRVRAGPGIPEGEEVLAGLSVPVDVLYDSVGIPHIFAASVEDAYRAQGRLHVHDRLWQMEFFRRVARGRLSEILGEAALPSDRFLRTLGMHRVAARAARTLDPDTRRLLEAYLEGVNAAIEGWSGLLPPEFLLLRFRPEPFTLEDLLALERIMAWDLTQYDEDLIHTETYEALGPEGFARVREAFPEGGTTILGGERGLAFPAGGEPADADEAGALAGLPLTELARTARIPDELRPMLRAVSAVHASNAWVVGGERSASGKPLLANDMHLALTRPALWYLVGLHAPGYDVVGMSIPGAPAVAVGRSRAVAWGYTNGMVDDADFYVERVDPTDTTRYLTPEGSEPFVRHVEVIEVAGRATPDTLVVRETRNGPVMTPVEARLDEPLVSLRWVAHADSSLIPAILAMNRAADADAFVEALRGFRTIHQNVVFADTAGNWGYRLGGRIPLRGGERPPIRPRPGWTGEAEWTGFLPFEEHPHALAPEAGYVVTANNRQQADSVGGLISNDMWSLPYRAERITRLVEGSGAHDVASMLAIQMDVTTLQGLRHREVAAAGYRAAGDEAAAAALEAWDGDTGLDGVEPTLFHTWFEALRGELSLEVRGRRGGFVSDAGVERWIDQGLPEGVAEAAARRALERPGSRPWGEQHYLHLDHQLAAVPILQRLFGFARTGIPLPGSSATPNVAGYVVDAEGRYRVTWGASERHVSDLAEEVGWFVLPGGQSGYPAGPHTDDQLELWLSGDLVPLPLTREGVEEIARARLRIVPE
jgi:penicillin amidase